MLTAAIAAIVAAIVVVVAVAIAFTIYTRKKSDSVGTRGRKVLSIDTFGVGSESDGFLDNSQRVSSQEDSVSTPSETLKSRFTALTILAGAIFAALFAKLFETQILSSTRYAKAATSNMYTTVSTPAPRGYIYDRNGVSLVKNRSNLCILADVDVATDRDVIRRLSAVIGVPHNVIRQRIQDANSGAQNKRTVAQGVSMREIAFIAEHPEGFPGVYTESRTVREYPYGALGAHVLGYTGAVSSAELEKSTPGRNIEMGDDVGKAGVESQYDDLLSGDHGQRVVRTDARGNVVEVISETKPTKGNDLYLTICAPIQYAADEALAETIAPIDGAIGSGKGTAGAVVVMDVRDGSILALASFPTYLPGAFVGGIASDMWSIYNAEESKNPLMNRAIAGAYPAASTFKAFTGMAGLTHGFVTKDRIFTCEGSWDGFGSNDWQNCWKLEGHGDLDFHEGIVVSCDIVFYEIAKDFFDHRNELGMTAMQEEIMKYGFGSKTGIDLNGEVEGRIPTPDWKSKYFKDVPEEAPFRGGDLTNMAIGQGYVLITPIQLAVGYGAIATGNLVLPHVLKEVRNSEGEVAATFEPQIIGTPDVKPEHLQTIRDALHGVRLDNASVCNAFDEYDIDAAAKTGTAEVAGKTDFAWTACYAPFDDPRYVVTVIVEEGGGGSSAATPIAAKIMSVTLDAEDYADEMDYGWVDGSTGKVIERSSIETGHRTD